MITSASFSFISLFYLVLIPFLTTQMLVPLVSKLSITFGGVDAPDERKIHTVAVPRLGGVAIFFGFIIAVLFIPEAPQVRGILMGGVIVFLTGVVDDVVGLRAVQKLAGQGLAALAVILVGNFSLTTVGNPFGLGTIELGWFALPFTLFALVGVMNAVNLMDGLDGLAGGYTVLACITFAIFGYRFNIPLLMYLPLALCGATAGFLIFNTHPARIFMGDAGSLLLGYCLGVFSILLMKNSVGNYSVLTPLLILAVPVIDTLVVMGCRWCCSKSIFSPDKTHLHHRLLDLGIGHRMTVLIVYGIAYLYCMLALLIGRSPDYLLFWLFVASGGLIYGLLRLAKCYQAKNRRQESEKSARSLESYRRMIELSQSLIGVIKWLLLILLAESMLVSNVPPWMIACSFAMIVTIVLCYLNGFSGSDRGLRYLLYGAVALIVFRSENHDIVYTVYDTELRTLVNGIWLLLFLCEGVKVVIRRRIDKLLNSPFEYFLLLLCLTVPLLPRELYEPYRLLHVVAKSMVFFVGYKLILISNTRDNRKIILATILALMPFW